MTNKCQIVARLPKPGFLSVAVSLILTTTVALAQAESENSKVTSPQGVIFSELLPDVPGKRITVVELNFKPNGTAAAAPAHRDHRHPGSVYVYVTKGSVRWGVEGRAVRELHAGDSYFEPAGILHTVGENASTTEPASVIAVMIVPDGAPLVIAK